MEVVNMIKWGKKWGVRCNVHVGWLSRMAMGIWGNGRAILPQVKAFSQKKNERQNNEYHQEYILL